MSALSAALDRRKMLNRFEEPGPYPPLPPGPYTLTRKTHGGAEAVSGFEDLESALYLYAHWLTDMAIAHMILTDATGAVIKQCQSDPSTVQSVPASEFGDVGY